MNSIQERIDHIVKHLPDGRIQFMGYVWREDLIRPVQDFNELRNPTIMQCIEYMLGVDLYFIYNEELPPVIYGEQAEYYSFERYAAGRMLHPHEIYLEHFLCKEPKNPYNEPRGEKIEGYTKYDFAEDLRILTGIVLQIYDDMIKDIHIGLLPDGKDGTVPKGAVLEWLRGYMQEDAGQVDYSCLSKEEKRKLIKIWKQPGSRHKTLLEIMMELWPDEAKEIINSDKNDKVFQRLRGRIRTLEGAR